MGVFEDACMEGPGRRTLLYRSSLCVGARVRAQLLGWGRRALSECTTRIIRVCELTLCASQVVSGRYKGSAQMMRKVLLERTDVAKSTRVEQGIRH